MRLLIEKDSMFESYEDLYTLKRVLILMIDENAFHLNFSLCEVFYDIISLKLALDLFETTLMYVIA